MANKIHLKMITPSREMYDGDADMVILARDIAKQIESELQYPGQIKVSLIRESRATDIAK